jgi:hypothetical protein
VSFFPFVCGLFCGVMAKLALHLPITPHFAKLQNLSNA